MLRPRGGSTVLASTQRMDGTIVRLLRAGSPSCRDKGEHSHRGDAEETNRRAAAAGTAEGVHPGRGDTEAAAGTGCSTTWMGGSEMVGRKERVSSTREPRPGIQVAPADDVQPPSSASFSQDQLDAAGRLVSVDEKGQCCERDPTEGLTASRLIGRPSSRAWTGRSLDRSGFRSRRRCSSV